MTHLMIHRTLRMKLAPLSQVEPYSCTEYLENIQRWLRGMIARRNGVPTSDPRVVRRGGNTWIEQTFDTLS